MPNQTQKRLSIVESLRNQELNDTFAADPDQRNSFESFGGASQSNLNQTFQQPSSYEDGRNRITSPDTVMWGYSPNFNMKQRMQSSSSEEGTVNKLRLSDEELQTFYHALREKLQELKSTENDVIKERQAYELLEILQQAFDLEPKEASDDIISKKMGGLQRFQERDEAAKELFIQYLSNIESIDFAGEDNLTAYEHLSMHFDQFLVALLHLVGLAETKNQEFNHKVLQRIVQDDKVRKEIKIATEQLQSVRQVRQAQERTYTGFKEMHSIEESSQAAKIQYSSGHDAQAEVTYEREPGNPVKILVILDSQPIADNLDYDDPLIKNLQIVQSSKNRHLEVDREYLSQLEGALAKFMASKRRKPTLSLLKRLLEQL